MKTAIILLLAVISFFHNPFPAEAGMGDKVISTTIKSTVKAYIAVKNIKKLKKKIANKLEGMDKGKFRIRYAELYELIKDLPPDIKTAYKITPHMTREQMIKNVESVDKKKIYKIINRIPDKTVAGLFKQYLSGMKEKSKKKECTKNIQQGAGGKE